MNIVFRLTKDKKMLKQSLTSCLLITCCVSMIESSASSLALESEINASTSYDDNVTYSSSANDESSTIITITPKVKLTHYNDQWETTANARVSGTSYSAQLQNQFDSYVDFGTAYKQDRGIYSIAASYNVHTNRAEETNILGESIDQLDVKTFSIKPNYTYLLTERASLSVAVDFSSVDYGLNMQSSYFSYDTRTASGVLDYKLSQKSKLDLTLAAMDYASDNGASEYTVLSSKVGIAHKLSESITSKISVGISDRKFYDRSNQTFNFFGSTVTGMTELETSSSGASYLAEVDARWVTVGASRDYLSNSVGGLNLSEKINVKFRMQITSLIGITLTLDKSEVTELNDFVPDYSYSETRIIPAMNFTLAHNLSASARYVRGEKEIISSVRDDSIDYNIFYLSMRYVFPSI